LPRITKALKVIFVGCFFGILALPAIQLAFHPFKHVPLPENRAELFHPYDNLTHLWDGGGRASIDFEKWFNVVYPMRDIYVRAVNQITYSLFRESNQVLVNKDGYTMDRFTVLNNQRAEDDMTDAQLNDLVVKIIAARDYFSRRGQTLILLPVPFKNTFDKTITFKEIRRPPLTGYDRLVAKLSDGAVPAGDVVGALAKARRYGKEFPYFRTDLHWNYTGAYYVAETIVNAVNEREGKSIIRFEDQFSKAGDLVGGDTEALALLWPAKESYWTPAVVTHAQEHRGALPNGNDAWYYTSERPLLPTVAIVGNSFMMYFPPTGLYDYFQKTYLIHDLSHFSELSSYVPGEAKYIFWEFFETEIPIQLSTPSWWAWLDATASR
jgi:SGNH hydrolase-like domain, acetyltransferase AlgX